MTECQFCHNEMSLYEEEESPKTNLHPTCEHCWNLIENNGKYPDELKHYNTLEDDGDSL